MNSLFRVSRSVFLTALLAVSLSFQAAGAALPKDVRHILGRSRAASLKSQIEKILNQPDVAAGTWGIEVGRLDSEKPLVSINADKLFTPASNTKLFTTAAVFDLIGSEYTFKTTVETRGALDRLGRLNGDLVVTGRGDPNLSGRALPYNVKTERTLPPEHVFEQLADEVVKKGVRYIDGDIVGDDSYFAYQRFGEGWSQDDLVWEWGAPVSALSVNDNVVFVNILPGSSSGEKAFVAITPYPDYYHIENHILTTPLGTGPRKIYINREPGSSIVVLWGNIPQDDTGAVESLAIENPADFVAKLFRSLLEKRGVTVYGHARTQHTELASLMTLKVSVTMPGGGEVVPAEPHSPMVLASYQSQPLGEDLRIINKVSQNLHAEMMLRLLGREKGTVGTIERGLEVQRGVFTKAGITADEYAFFDGSGLSRENLVTPRAIVKLLRYAANQTWGKEFADTLPIAGMDGTLAERLKGTPVEGKMQGKTGSLGHVNALSGYVTTVKGEHLAFSVLVNNHLMTSKRALEVIDQIAVAIADDSK